jgi:hypothetical protein
MVDIVQNCIWLAVIDMLLWDYKFLRILDLFASLIIEAYQSLTYMNTDDRWILHVLMLR